PRNCFNKSKGVFITDPKLKALLNPQPSWGFSGHNKKRANNGALWCADLETKKAPIVGAIVFIFLSEF
ncbi:hypothetical protein ADT36_16175, partial (plasmid) [Yersinia pestis subsp. microtus bv. Caucasica]